MITTKNHTVIKLITVWQKDDISIRKSPLNILQENIIRNFFLLVNSFLEMLSLNIKFNENAKRKYKYYAISSAGKNTSPVNSSLCLSQTINAKQPSQGRKRR